MLSTCVDECSFGSRRRSRARPAVSVGLVITATGAVIATSGLALPGPRANLPCPNFEAPGVNHRPRRWRAGRLHRVPLLTARRRDAVTVQHVGSSNRTRLTASLEIVARSTLKLLAMVLWLSP